MTHQEIQQMAQEFICKICAEYTQESETLKKNMFSESYMIAEGMVKIEYIVQLEVMAKFLERLEGECLTTDVLDQSIGDVTRSLISELPKQEDLVSAFKAIGGMTAYKKLLAELELWKHLLERSKE